GDGGQTRDFIHVADVVQAIEKALITKVSNDIILNIGTGRPTSVNELAHKMIKAFRANVKPIYTSPRKGDIRHSYADITKAKKLLSWEPKIGLDEGIRELIKYGESTR
ncbi:MAG: GDP-mannose 4,6-dehydratase, partial [Desulfurococcales archaeon]|nr:GDP-mannose 4,6-dehydratase [Desulfurococcales archaeon]